MKISQLLFISVCLIIAACSSKKEAETVDTHKVVNPVLEDITYSNDYVANIHSVKYVEIRSKIKGYIEKIHVDEGQPVKRGQLLFTLSFLVFEKELQKADAAYKNAIADLKAAEVELINVKLLVAKNIVSGTELDVKKAKVEALKATVEEAKAHKEQAALKLSFAHIKAPFDGVINRIPNKVGSLIEEGGRLTTISDNREVFVYFNLSEIDYLNYMANGEQKTKTVSLKLANNRPYGHEGKIEMIESEFDQSTGNIAFRARFPNPDAILKHGSNGKVIVKKQLKNALLVPQKSTFEIQDKLYVFVVNQEDVLEQRNIVPKLRLPDFYVVESGLTNEERILFEGAGNERDGKKIHPAPVDLAKAMSLNGKDS
ncbi:Membrane fusion protein (Multidrug efflux system) [Candidatus Methylobacter favarea]|uniref:Membrane fusion protein (Multidrug efflux system) n=1 Tax=Candidatus Methylobacter favarea TaxID=2707345 RepID=A0A8S0WLW9_9GAMM|nr:efflux RND transporter periplasmic adaptor subunit [Candidatus Methylobacter favarea]CAA9892920.1 Membrane fusion protein (Multidrug efflux system) [Candidatus Methylobacter favarea]